MKNWEKYEKQIKENGLAHIAVTKNGKMKMCNKECDDCIFNDNENTHCSDSFLDWLYEEATPWLTKQERTILEAFGETAYLPLNLHIARDNEGLFLYTIKPEKFLSAWMAPHSKDDNIFNKIALNKNLFKFITCYDEETWSIEDLLKLEVED